ncbi:MAG: sigma-70 family RNA polymerase sigma factor [Phaeodactylibacter sp.]|nr:sigma-70 family RNA polymerase sigma factor [Phaeodactylibacter sp.]MCB9049489.1 sigma-70 family RNA polymerase sigma factor [Lewinellaceae bacterium]
MKENEAQATLKEVVEKARTGEPRAEALLYRYLSQECYPRIERYLRNRGGLPDDARDLFQDAVIILLEAIKAEKFAFNTISLRSYGGQLCAYLMSVVKNLWRKELRWRGRGGGEEEEQEQGLGEAVLAMDFFSALVIDKFQALGEDCQVVLVLFFKEELSARVIAGQQGKKTQEVNQRLSKCVDSLLRGIGEYLGSDHQGQLMELMKEGMEGLEERCRTILELFYFERKSMTELAEQLGYANAHSVTEQKRRCMERLNYAVVNRLMNS